MTYQDPKGDQIRVDDRIRLATEALRNELIDEAIESGNPELLAAAFQAVAESRRRFDGARNVEISRD